MLVGHFGVGLGLKARYPSVPLGPILVACCLPDWLLVLYTLAGWETLGAPPRFFQPTTFEAIPFSHDFSMVAMYACLTASMGLLLWSSRWALALGFGVASHIVLDGFVHAPDLGVIGPWVPVQVGLDLWSRAPWLAWLVELAIVVAGSGLYLRARKRTTRVLAVPLVLVLVHMLALFVS